MSWLDASWNQAVAINQPRKKLLNQCNQSRKPYRGALEQKVHRLGNGIKGFGDLIHLAAESLQPLGGDAGRVSFRDVVEGLQLNETPIARSIAGVGGAVNQRSDQQELQVELSFALDALALLNF